MLKLIRSRQIRSDNPYKKQQGLSHGCNQVEIRDRLPKTALFLLLFHTSGAYIFVGAHVHCATQDAIISSKVCCYSGGHSGVVTSIDAR